MDMVRPTVLENHSWKFKNLNKRHGLVEPTWINLIRDPITWFESSFYFKRLGWSQKPGARRRTDVDTTIEQCIEKRHPDCEFSTWKYIQFFCGNTPNVCKFRKHWLSILVFRFKLKLYRVTFLFFQYYDDFWKPS